ncbi:LysR family transcriptional regulator [Microbulbifer elongatus]|uniref:LysR family transcriptional regulator n=1 Tax=Microbulbifer elongatus TaxID=86173 RepID=A0ABT1P443_9GAMM|nr:LysR family transcriptional regulator [Microbulbifer elongatus]MCQ3830886.1 LysR family transcriptional regulator [Microbulbifer elongatus]
MINAVWLNTFCTLVEVGHFTRTAERLHMTQSGVSQHVRKLEERLGVQLLVREGKRFSVSDAGERLYAEAQGILAALSGLPDKVQEDTPFEGVVRVMSPGSVGLKLYGHLLALQCRYPQLVIEYRFAPNAEVEAALIESRVDIGFMTSESVSAEVRCRPVAQESLLLVTPANTVAPDWSALMALGFIDHPDGRHHANLLLGPNYLEFRHSGQFPLSGFSNQIGLILEPVSRGLGFTVLPAHAVEAFARPEQIRVHPLSTPVSETLYLCGRREKGLQKRVETVIAEALRWLEV